MEEKHCTFELTNELKHKIATLYRLDIDSFLHEIEITGERKADYCNGIIVLRLTGVKRQIKNRKFDSKYVAYRGGIRVVGKRIRIVNGVQHIQLLEVFDENFQNAAYRQMLENLRHGSKEPLDTGYVSGMPCNRKDDKTPDDKRPNHWINMIML
eukprot:TRINITY_DN26752_c0_g1_i1.p1 TRINITY_DN26752_c0_g1~~TRINITY_DN26752_c0_g1_i1.p1  ORF type:complete len:154 (+),score=0.96 TRINITY_DN26752_c0_g1_i1:11-472(+)